MKYKLSIKMQSDALLGSGEGVGGTIDSDIYYDELGIPYLPAKRIKGCLRDSAFEVQSFLQTIKLPAPSVESIFGFKGKNNAVFSLTNAKLVDYDKIKNWIQYLLDSEGSIFTVEDVKEFFTETRYSTAIEQSTGVAQKKSLRNARVLRKGFEFESSILFYLEEIREDVIDLLSLAIQNLRYLGTSRSRGLGNVKCTLFHAGKSVVGKTHSKIQNLQGVV